MIDLLKWAHTWPVSRWTNRMAAVRSGLNVPGGIFIDSAADPAPRTQERPATLSLKKNFAWTFLGNVVYGACQWGILVLLAKIGNPEMVGQFALGLAVCAPVLMFTNLNLRAVQATDVKGEYLFGQYLGLRLLTTLLALLVIIAIGLKSNYSRETLIVILAVAVAKSLESIIDAFYGLLQQHERMDRIASSMIIRSLLYLVGLGLGVYLTGQIKWGVAGFALAGVLTLVFYDFGHGVRTLAESPRLGTKTLWEALRPQWQVGTIQKIVRLSLPLGLAMMLLSLTNNIPRYFIESHIGLRELGLFAAISQLMVAGNTVVAALGHSASPRLAKYYAAGDRKSFNGLLLKLVALGAVLGLVGWLVSVAGGRQILQIFYRPEYGRHADILNWVMLAAGFFYIGNFLGYGATAMRVFDRFVIPYALVVLITLGCSWLLIPAYGLLGAAWTLGTVGLAICAMTLVILKMPVKPNVAGR